MAAYFLPSKSVHVCCALAGPAIVCPPIAAKPPIFSGCAYLNLTKSPSIHLPSAPDGVSVLSKPGNNFTFVRGIRYFTPC